MNITLDTRVLVAGLLTSQDSAAEFYDAWERSRFTLLIHQHQIEELREITRHPFFKDRVRSSAVELLAAHLLAFGKLADEAEVSQLHARQSTRPSIPLYNKILKDLKIESGE